MISPETAWGFARCQSRVTFGVMAETKTKPTEAAVAQFIAAIEPPAKSADGQVLDTLFRKVTGEAPRMWGPTIVGYGEYNQRALLRQWADCLERPVATA